MGSVRKVYVSSTRRDLLRERNTALMQLRLLGHQPVSSIPEEMQGAPGPRRILDECLADLDECSAYVGIFGWCYGTRPAGREKSYTELEFDHAMSKVEAATMDAFLFVGAPESRWSECGGQVAADPDDRKRVGAFREKIAALGRISVAFEPGGGAHEKQLAMLLPPRLARHLGVADRERLGVLPHLCDRREQDDSLQLLVEGAGRDYSTPLVILVGGGVEHLPPGFLQSLREARLARLLDERDPPRRRVLLPWPQSTDVAAFLAELRRSLSRELAAVGRDPVAVLGRMDGLVVVDTFVAPGRADVVRTEILKAFVEFWTAMRLPERRHPVVVIACSERPERTGLLDRIRGTQGRIDAALQRVMSEAAFAKGDRAAPLPLLRPVAKSDVVAWMQRDDVLALCGAGDHGDEVERFFDGDVERPMRDVARFLGSLIERCASGKGAGT
jgi:hypothetical protein